MSIPSAIGPTEANRSSGSQNIPCFFIEPESSLPYSWEPAGCPCAKPGILSVPSCPFL